MNRSGNIILLKKNQRKNIRTRINGLTSNQIREKSAIIASKLFTTRWWKDSTLVFGFITMPGEVDTEYIIQQALKDLKKAAIPRIKGDDLVFYRYYGKKADLIPNQFGILEPDQNSPCIDSTKLENELILILCPGMCFDRSKQRMGRGKGYYDRLLKFLRENKSVQICAVGIGFSEQIILEVPVDSHDQPLDGLITDSEIM